MRLLQLTFKTEYHMAKRASGLVQIKKRLRAGTVTKADLKKISSLVLQTEKAAKALRAAMVE